MSASVLDLFAIYEDLLKDDALFGHALAAGMQAVCGESAVGHLAGGAAESGTVSVHGLFVLLEVAAEMLAEAGLHNVLVVFRAVRKHASPHFERNALWKSCHLSGVSVRGCLKLSDDVHVHPRHEKFVLSLWLCLHMRDMERGREAVPAKHVAVYRAAAACVVQQFQGAHAHVVAQLRDNMLKSKVW